VRWGQKSPPLTPPSQEGLKTPYAGKEVAHSLLWATITKQASGVGEKVPETRDTDKPI